MPDTNGLPDKFQSHIREYRPPEYPSEDLLSSLASEPATCG